MIRALALTAALASLVAFGQVPKVPADHNPQNAMTEQQKCQAKCGEAMSACMMPCLGGDPDEAAKPENRSKTMGCVKKCSDAQEPCMKVCDTKKN
jgi:hypothetical protein